jgi:hypothetical protein
MVSSTTLSPRFCAHLPRKTPRISHAISQNPRKNAKITAPEKNRHNRTKSKAGKSAVPAHRSSPAEDDRAAEETAPHAP